MANNSPEIVTLVTVDHPFQYFGRAPMQANTVITLDSPRTTYHVQKKYPFLDMDDLEVHEWKLTLPLDAAVCFSAFYKRTMIDCSTRRYECHSLPQFVWGETGFIKKSEGDADPELAGDRVRACDLEAGLPYLMVSDDQRITHEALGMGTEPEYRKYCLGVLGGNGPVAITSTMQTMNTFGASHIRAALYGAAAAIAS
jgi:hypothetical protein